MTISTTVPKTFFDKHVYFFMLLIFFRCHETVFLLSGMVFVDYETFFFAIDVFFIIFFLSVSWGSGFRYHSADQRRWKRRHNGCGGHMQSPISVSARKAIPLRMPALEMVGYHNPLPGPIKFHNNGHSGKSINTYLVIHSHANLNFSK